MCLLNVMQNSLSRQLSLPGREQHIVLLPVMFQCATASSDASHLTLLLAVRYSSGCQAHLDAQRRLHTIAQMSTVLQLCSAGTRCQSPSTAVVKQSLPASSSLKASQSSALNSSMACRKVISSTWPPANRSISPLLLALTCAGLKEDILTVRLRSRSSQDQA